MTSPTHSHQLQPLPLAAAAALATEGTAVAASASAAAAAAASSSAAAAAASQPLVYSLARCSHCRYPNLLLPGRSCSPDFALLDGSDSSAARHPLVWPLPRVLALQVRIDADGAIAARTAAYLAKLDEFRTLSRALPSSGSQQQQHQQQQSRDQRRGSGGVFSGGGAQLEESKQSQESSPPSSSSVNSVSSAVHASRVEQQLLHSRDELLQCVEARDKLAALASPSAAADEPLEPLTHREFTATHLRLLRVLFAPANANLPPLISSGLLELVSRFLEERASILAEKRSLDAAWHLVQTALDMQAERTLQLSSLDDAAAAAAAASAAATSTATATELGTIAVDVLLNVFHCRFQKQELLLQLRLEPFQQLLSELGDLLLRLHDATALQAAASFATDSVPLPLLANLRPPSADAPASVHQVWRDTLAQGRALARLEHTPPSLRHADLRASTILVERRRQGCEDATAAMSRADLDLCAEYCRALYCDLVGSMALPLRQRLEASPALVAQLQLQKQEQAQANQAAESSLRLSQLGDDGGREEVSMTPPAGATPAPAQVTPQPALRASSARKHRTHHQQQQQQQASGSGGKFPNAVFRAHHRHHPYQPR